MKLRMFSLSVVFALMCGPAIADEIGHVDTTFKLLGANHKIVVEAFPTEARVCRFRQPPLLLTNK